MLLLFLWGKNVADPLGSYISRKSWSFVLNIMMGRKDVDALFTALAEFHVWPYVIFTRSIGRAEQLHSAYLKKMS